MHVDSPDVLLRSVYHHAQHNDGKRNKVWQYNLQKTRAKENKRYVEHNKGDAHFRRAKTKIRDFELIGCGKCEVRTGHEPGKNQHQYIQQPRRDIIHQERVADKNRAQKQTLLMWEHFSNIVAKHSPALFKSKAQRVPDKAAELLHFYEQLTEKQQEYLNTGRDLGQKMVNWKDIPGPEFKNHLRALAEWCQSVQNLDAVAPKSTKTVDG